MSTATLDRAHGALAGLAIGDALGMPTQFLLRPQVTMLFPDLSGFEAGPEENEISRGVPAATVTDDTRQALILAELLVEGGGTIDGRLFARRLEDWGREANASASGEQLGPSTRRALEAVAAGESPENAGRWGDTNGAAMRITPVGIGIPDREDLLLAAVEGACRPTHNTGIAISGAAAVAGAVAAGVDGAGPEAALDRGTALAAAAAGRGHQVPGASVAARIAWARELVAARSPAEGLDLVERLVGTGVATQETVPAAFAIASMWPGSPWDACLAAARLGGDSDTIAAIVGTILGACHGVIGFPPSAIDRVERVNGLGLGHIAERLLELRVMIFGARPGAPSAANDHRLGGGTR